MVVSLCGTQPDATLLLQGASALNPAATASGCTKATSHADNLLAGEVPWVMRIAKAHHAEAARKGVKIVHFCGFDSIPSDLGTTFMVDHMQDKLNR